MIILWVKGRSRFEGLSHCVFFGLYGRRGTKDLLKANKCLFIQLFSPFFVTFIMGEGVH